MIFGKVEIASLFTFSRITLLLIIFHLVPSDQNANAFPLSGNELMVNSKENNIVSEPIQLAFTTVSSSCSNSSDGSIDVYITGGVEPFTFLWSDGSIAEDLLLVKAGEYSVQVTDANGISQTSTAVIEAPQEFALKTEITNCSEKSLAGFIEIQLTGGTAPYKYSWSNGENKSMVANLNPGVYSLTFTDLNGCSGFFSTEIYMLSDISISYKTDKENSQTLKNNFVNLNEALNKLP